MSSRVTSTPATWARTLVSLTVELSLAIIGDQSTAPRPFRAAMVGGRTDRHLSSRSRQLSLELESGREGEQDRGRVRTREN